MQADIPRAERSDWYGEDALTLSAGGYEAVVIPGAGANCVSLRHAQYGADLLRTPPGAAQLRERPQVYGLPFLFPPNRIRGGYFEHAGRAYRFAVNEPERGNHIHGDLIHCPFTVRTLSATGGEARAVLSFTNDETAPYYRGFPNRFTATASVTLSWQGLAHTAVIENHSDFPLPLGVGFHTAFAVPFAAGGSTRDCRLRVSVDQHWPIDRSGAAVTLGHTDTDPAVRSALRETGVSPDAPFPAAQWSAAPIDRNGKPFLGALLRDEAAGLELVYEVGGPYRFFVLWNDGGDKGFACVEPQTWLINAPLCGLPSAVSGFAPIPPGGRLVCPSRIAVERIE